MRATPSFVRHAAALAVCAFVPAPIRAQGLAIEHEPVTCVVAGRFPKLSACFQPVARLARARVYFRGASGRSWYFVEMRPEAPCHTAILPKPTLKLTSVEYYIETIDKAFVSGRTPAYAAAVVDQSRECLTPFVERAAVTVGGAAMAGSGFIAGAGLGTVAVVAGGAAVVGGVIVGAGGVGGGATTSPPGTGPPGTGPSTTAPPGTTTPGTTLPGTTTTTATTTTTITLLPTTLTLPTTTIPTLPTTTIPTLPTTTIPTLPTTTLLRWDSLRTLGERGRGDDSAGRPLAWTSGLDVPGARGQVVVNGASAMYLNVGRVFASARVRGGENRIEAQLVVGRGRPGTWRFEMGPGGFEPGSLRVVAGTPMIVDGGAVVFRLRGEPGERVVFMFRAR